MSGSGVALSFDVAFETITCSECQGVFAVNQQSKQRWRDTGKTFYCPYCSSSQCYRESKIDKLKKRIQWAEERAERLSNENLDLSKKVSAQRGVATKLKKRIANGTCPCCKRSFQNLKRHMDNKHPEYTDAKRKK